ncbi:MAG: hypothetical protein GY842_27800 [bacterium]|nr:hypothetical protein [bacterium]
MTAQELRQIEQNALSEYVWRRLRNEPGQVPPLESHFADELPESFLIDAVLKDDSPRFRERVDVALKDSLRRLAVERSTDPDAYAGDERSDEQLARIAFVASRIKSSALVGPLYRFACSWLLDAEQNGRLTEGQKHVLRTLAQLQSPGVLERFWEAMWDRGPRVMRGLFFFGWVRADSRAALARLGDLAEMGSQIDLATTIWSLVGQYGPGLLDLSRTAAKLTPQRRAVVRNALAEGGADENMLRRFDAEAEPTPPASDVGEFPFAPDTVPPDRAAARQRPEWYPVAA